MSEPAIKSVAPWFGGKRTLAPSIVRQLGKHAHYVEPLCGSLAVLLHKGPVRMETVNDLHGDLINLVRVIQSPAAERLYDRLIGVLVGDDTLATAAGELANTAGLVDAMHAGPQSDAAISRAWCYFVASWMARSGFAGLAQSQERYDLAVRWTTGGGAPATRFRSAVASLPGWHRRLSNVVVLNRDAFEIIPKISDTADTAIYVDPPYLPETRVGGTYEHDFETRSGGLFALRDDHERLAATLREFKNARIVISYYDAPRLRELYPGWEILEQTCNKQLHAAGGRGSRSATAAEVLLINGPAI